MERSKGPSLASPLPSPKAEPNRLRKKLQKPSVKQRSYLAKRPSSGLAVPQESMENKAGSTAILSGSQVQARQRPSASVPEPDLSDAKWLEYLRSSGLFAPMEQEPPASLASSPPQATKDSRSKRPPRVPRIVVPEPAHITVNTNETVAGQRTSRNSPSLLDTPASATSTIMRRRAKTPVLHIGQLEALSTVTADAAAPVANGEPERRTTFPLDAPLPLRLQPATASKTSSVELIAEQYRALLESRCSMLTDSLSEPALSSRADDDDGGRRISFDRETVIRHGSLDDLPLSSDAANTLGMLHEDGQHRFTHSRNTTHSASSSVSRTGLLQPPPPPIVTRAANGTLSSPHSDDGTLVAMEEETVAVYFKPVSFSPPSTPTTGSGPSHASSPFSSPGNVHLGSATTPQQSPGFLPAAAYEGNQPQSPLRSPLRSPFAPSSPPAPPVRHPDHHGAFFSPGPTPPQSDNLSLQICLDLLTRELSSAMMLGGGRGTSSSKRQPRGPLGPDVSALQVWVMIEAYERLRDVVLELAGRDINHSMGGTSDVGERDREQQQAAALKPVEQMLDVWLRALYTVHDTLAEEAAEERKRTAGEEAGEVKWSDRARSGSVSGSEYEVLEAEAEAVD